jgi:hypothetical protein
MNKIVWLSDDICSAEREASLLTVEPSEVMNGVVPIELRMEPSNSTEERCLRFTAYAYAGELLQEYKRLTEDALAQAIRRAREAESRNG